MTYSRFAQLWRALVTDRVRAPGTKPDPLPHTPASPHLVDALVRAADGDHSDFDRAREIIAEGDAQLAEDKDAEARMRMHGICAAECDIREHRRQIGDPTL